MLTAGVSKKKMQRSVHVREGWGGGGDAAGAVLEGEAGE